jgi:hypothetical protein
VAETCGNVDNCSAIIFENCTQKAKHYTRNATNPFVQLSYRLQEDSLFEICELALSNDSAFSCKIPNYCCMMYKNRRCCLIVSIEKQRQWSKGLNSLKTVYFWLWRQWISIIDQRWLNKDLTTSASWALSGRWVQNRWRIKPCAWINLCVWRTGALTWS